MSDLTKCQFIIMLCLQSKNLPRDQRVLLHSGFLVLRYYIAIKKWNVFAFTVSLFLFILTLKGLKICLGFWIHMLWIYSQKLKSLHTAVAIHAAKPPTVLVKPSIKGRAPFLLPGAGQLSTARQHQTWWRFIRLPPHNCWGKQGYREPAFKPFGKEESCCLQ